MLILPRGLKLLTIKVTTSVLTSNKCLTPQQREALRKKRDDLYEERHKFRLERRNTFDFAGRKIGQEDFVVEYDMNKYTNFLKMHFQ